MHIKKHQLYKWKENSVKTARKLGYNEKILEFLEQNLILNLNRHKIPQGLWYGWAHYNDEKPTVEVFHKNLSCEEIPVIAEGLRLKGVPQKTIGMVTALLRVVPRRVFFDIYNQSGMDHELIGHLYNKFAGKAHGEQAAVDVQIEFCKARSGWFFHKLPWKIISMFAPIILYHHKKDEF